MKRLAFETGGAYRREMADSESASGDSGEKLERPEEVGQRAFGEAIGRLGPVLLGGLDALEQAFRRLHPPDLPVLRTRLAPARVALEEAIKAFTSVRTPPALEEFRKRFEESARLTAEALGGIVDPRSPEEGTARILESMHQHARAQAEIYPLRDVLPPVSSFFAEARCRDDLESLEVRVGVEARVGLFRSGEAGARGGFDLYVPESYDGSEAWPLVMALHGGAGNGADFLWSWLREARCRGFFLLTPTSRSSTWSLHAPELDGRALRQMTEWVKSKWNVDSEHVLLTGLSDGATMTLLVGLAEEAPFTHLAPISGVLHPMNFSNGNLVRAREKPIYLVHGGLDWLFPVALAREAARVLREAEAPLVFREIEDLSHTYPREENIRIIEWFDPRRTFSSSSVSS